MLISPLLYILYDYAIESARYKYLSASYIFGCYVIL